MPEPSILTKVDDLINEALGLEVGRLKYKHKETCQSFSKEIHPKIRWEALIGNILEQIEKKNWDRKRSPSAKNWRWEENPKINAKNRSLEVVLERLIVGGRSENYWVNQVPVASGVAGSGDRRRAIDLVHRCENGWYEFIELKVNEGAGTPLFAAMEILQYGLLYIFSREHAEDLGYTKARGYDEESIKVLNAPGIHLKVLAPAAYYSKYNLSWLEKGIKSGLKEILDQRDLRFEMDFTFASLSLIPSDSPVKWLGQA